MYDQAVINALVLLRDPGNLSRDEREAFNALDNAGVFRAIDEQTGYDVGPGVPIDHTQPDDSEELGKFIASLDPAEWGDTTREDMARHQMDAGDRAAMGRLARRAFHAHEASRSNDCAECSRLADRADRISSGNGTEFS